MVKHTLCGVFYSTFLITFIVLLVHDVYRTFILLLSYFCYTFYLGFDRRGSGRCRRSGAADGSWMGVMPRSSHVHLARVGSDARRLIAVWALLSGSMMGFLSVGLLVGEERGDFVGGEAETKRTVPLKSYQDSLQNFESPNLPEAKAIRPKWEGLSPKNESLTNEKS